MNHLNRLAITIILLMFGSSFVMAATCEIQYTRTACPGKEKISYKKCKGKKSCSKFKEAGDIDECRKMANKSCANKRYSITKSKVINAIFDGQSLQTVNGEDNFCLEYENVATEFNQCNR